MKANRWLLWFLMGFGLAASRADVEEPGPGVALLAEQDSSGEFAGWKRFSEEAGKRTGDVWCLGKDGVLVCRGTPLGYLYTEAPQTDFILTLEWRWPPGGQPGKGGVLFRMSGEHGIWPRSLEAQLNAGGAGDFWALGGFELGGPAERLKTVMHPRFGRLSHLPRLRGSEKAPGEWNRMEIEARGGTVILRMNGEEVNRAGGCAVQPGPILLTVEGSEIQFRHLRLQAGS